MMDQSKRPPEPNMASGLRRIASRFDIDRAVSYAMVQRIWQLMAGPVTLILIARNMSPDMQGFYYTFWTVAAAQMFFELALPSTLIVAASQYWATLKLTDRREIVGDPDAKARLYDLTRLSMLISSAFGVVFTVSVGLVGYWLFASTSNPGDVTWRLPWIAFMGCSYIVFAMMPLFAVLEGCNRIGGIYQLQFVRSVFGNIVVWISMPLGFGLWIPAITLLVRLICDVWMVVVRYGRFFRSMGNSTSDARVDWRKDVWPFQSRIMLKGMFFYLNFDLMGPVVLYYSTKAFAGQLGMTIQVLNAVRAICSSWGRVRFAQMGTLASQGKYSELDSVFRRIASIGILSMAALSTAYLIGLLFLTWLFPKFADRLLPIAPTILLLLGLQAALIAEYLWTYIHSYKVSPQLALSLFVSFLSGALIWWWGAYYDRLGVTAAYCVVQTLVNLPIVVMTWRQIRETRAVAQ